PAQVSAVTTETVVGVAGRRVTLPCRSEAVNKRGVEVCWGRGEPSLFTCHNTVMNTAGDQVSYRRSYRYSVSSSSSLSIFNSRPADSGFYHCRVQLPGLFNDQTSTVHLIIISPRSAVSGDGDAENLNAPRTATSYSTRDVTGETGSDVSNTTEPMVAQVQSAVQQQQVNSLHMFIGNTVRLSFIIFIPALLLT
ncbi:hepatitis A virus cellular receptor 1 homolog, partial [Seriola lalandi dorsalis]|uniref:hepatitis A virus cellular receptor 1 homolog n=1 Tax=Seriola lalandi dorsalis TaxID=1841481 RepID=UPI000C6FBDCE